MNRPVVVIAAALLGGCTWTESGAAKHTTFLMATQLTMPEHTTGTLSLSADPERSVAALERTASTLPRDLTNAFVERAISNGRPTTP